MPAPLEPPDGGGVEEDVPWPDDGPEGRPAVADGDVAALPAAVGLAPTFDAVEDALALDPTGEDAEAGELPVALVVELLAGVAAPADAVGALPVFAPEKADAAAADRGSMPWPVLAGVAAALAKPAFEGALADALDCEDVPLAPGDAGVTGVGFAGADDAAAAEDAVAVPAVALVTGVDDTAPPLSGA